MACEQLLDPISLHADASSVNQANLAETLFDSHLEVRVHHIRHITWWKRVKVDAVLYRDLERLFRIENFVVSRFIGRHLEYRTVNWITRSAQQEHCCHDGQNATKHAKTDPCFGPDSLRERPGGEGRYQKDKNLGRDIREPSFRITQEVLTHLVSLASTEFNRW